MKFHQLANGQIFHYQNQSYTKVSPVLATSNATGAQKFMRRADHVVVQDKSTAKPDKSVSGVINKTVVLQIIDQSFNACLQQLEENIIDESASVACQDIIAQHRDQLARRINGLSSVSNRIKTPKNK